MLGIADMPDAHDFGLCVASDIVLGLETFHSVI